MNYVIAPVLIMPKGQNIESHVNLKNESIPRLIPDPYSIRPLNIFKLIIVLNRNIFQILRKYLS